MGIGEQISPRRRASIVTMRLNGQKFPDIGKALKLKPNTCLKIFQHAKRNIPAEKKPSLSDLLRSENLDPSARSGRPKVLTTTDKDHIIATVKCDSETRRMSLNQIRNEANVTHVSSQTIFNTLHERGLAAYRETLVTIDGRAYETTATVL